MYIVIGTKVVSDSSGVPREFKKRKQAVNFIEGRRLQNAQIVQDIKGYTDRMKVPV